MDMFASITSAHQWPDDPSPRATYFILNIKDGDQADVYPPRICAYILHTQPLDTHTLLAPPIDHTQHLHIHIWHPVFCLPACVPPCGVPSPFLDPAAIAAAIHQHLRAQDTSITLNYSFTTPSQRPPAQFITLCPPHHHTIIHVPSLTPITIPPQLLTQPNPPSLPDLAQLLAPGGISSSPIREHLAPFLPAPRLRDIQRYLHRCRRHRRLQSPTHDATHSVAE